MSKFLDWLKAGEWSYTKFEKEFRTFKLKRKRDIIAEYIAQVPYFKVIGVPVFYIMLIVEWLPILIRIIIDNRAEVWCDIKLLFKGKK